MKEQFRVKGFKDGIKIALDKLHPGTGNNIKDINGKFYWIGSVSGIFEACDKILEEYEEMGIKVTLRQLYYDLVAAGIIPNDTNVYNKLGNLLVDGRYVGRIDWDCVEDRGRLPTIWQDWENPTDLLDDAINSYRLPRWSDQKYYVEVFTEKDALTNIVKPVTMKHHVGFCYNKGYSSASAMYGLSRRIMEKINEGKEVILLYLGDHDPSGMDMIRDIRDRVEEFLTQGEDTCEPNFKVVPIALTMEQIKEFNPPPNPAKISDPRAKWYISEFGDKSWEVEALKPNVMIKLVEDKIKEYIDMDKYNVWLKKERIQKRMMREFAEDIEDETGEDEDEST